MRSAVEAQLDEAQKGEWEMRNFLRAWRLHWSIAKEFFVEGPIVLGLMFVLLAPFLIPRVAFGIWLQEMRGEEWEEPFEENGK
jgi:hypothetical protein